MRQSPSMRNTRQADHPVDAQFTERWSPRAFTGEAMTEAEVMALLEAARWAPSSNNGQPWRFAIALRGDPLWDALLDSMNPTNRSWATHAGAIVAVASYQLAARAGSEAAKPNAMHAFDTGAAWAYLAMQASLSGWAAHGMGGFDKEQAARAIRLPVEHSLQMLAVIGRRGDAALLSDALREREAPNGRRPLTELAVRGSF